MCRPADMVQSGEPDEADTAPSPVQESETTQVCGAPRQSSNLKVNLLQICLAAAGLPAS